VTTAKTRTREILQFRAKLGTGLWRDFDIDGSDTLEDLAVAILTAFEFECDHSYGFYSKLKGNKSDSDEIYELFADMEGGSCNERAKGVQDTIIREVFSPKKRMLFLFDYGDNWSFLLTCTGTVKPETGVQYPHIRGGKGDAPEQYPACED
jgi:hypothetical protein